MAKVMAEGAEALKMGGLNRFIETPFVVIKNLSNKPVRIKPPHVPVECPCTSPAFGMQSICHPYKP
jgi:hypothetical protein